MDGMQSVFDLAEQFLKSLDDAKNNGDVQIAQTYMQHLRVLLESLEHVGYDEWRVELVEKIRDAIKE